MLQPILRTVMVSSNMWYTLRVWAFGNTFVIHCISSTQTWKEGGEQTSHVSSKSTDVYFSSTHPLYLFKPPLTRICFCRSTQAVYLNEGDLVLISFFYLNKPQNTCMALCAQSHFFPSIYGATSSSIQLPTFHDAQKYT